MFPNEETFFLVEEPNADRRYIWRAMSPEFFKQLKSRGATIYRVVVPMSSTSADALLLSKLPTEMKDPPAG